MLLLFTGSYYRIKFHIKDCFKINGKQTIEMPKNCEYVKLKNVERKIKLAFMIYADFEVFYSLKVMESKIQMSLTLTNIKSMLIVGTVKN